MRHKLVCYIGFLFLFTCNILYGQEQSFRYIEIDKKVNELISDTVDLSTPLFGYMSFLNLYCNGKVGLLRSISSENIWIRLPNPNASDEIVDPDYKDDILNRIVKQVVIFEDSVAAVITATRKGNQIISFFLCIDNKWYYNGEDVVRSNVLSEAHQSFCRKIDYKMASLRRIYSVRNTISDTTSCIAWLQRFGAKPHEYMLDLLSNHKLVTYGELHKRKQSWDFLQELIHDPNFAQHTKAVCLELPSYTQPLLDSFLKNEEIDKTIVLNILRAEQVFGWDDRGMFKFMVSLWHLNKRLPYNEKVQVYAVDFQIPFDSIKSAKEYRDYVENNKEDRDLHMFNLVKEITTNLPQKKSCLFIVGANHARKSSPEGTVVKAGTYLAQVFPAEYASVCIHDAMSRDNLGESYGEIRHGLWAHVFKINKDEPVAIPLGNSPFGIEPFDYIAEITYDIDCGTYKDMYDGYIYLGALTKINKKPYRLYKKFYTDSFIEELKRRAAITESPYGWYEMPVESLRRRNIIKTLKIVD